MRNVPSQDNSSYEDVVSTCYVLLLAIFTATANSLTDKFGSGGNQFIIEFVTIRIPSNAARMTGNRNPVDAVDYAYRIGKYEISRGMIEMANAEGGRGLSVAPMDFVTDGPGDGPRPDMPATVVHWTEAVRHINWMNASPRFPAAYKLSAQPGDAVCSANANIEFWVDGEPVNTSVLRYNLGDRLEGCRAVPDSYRTAVEPRGLWGLSESRASY